jgi:hypothetical protein
MRSNAPRLLPEFREFQRRNGAPSHYRHLAITEEMASWSFLQPVADIGGVILANLGGNFEIGTEERGAKLGH